ncbi:DHS-like NAD/FAD-binding domain-containing protein [Stereum hirsutum FP-91666 SS1]|uniref:DHS-like NAD/FAD-binding domain-containing protein n=1 Tax=Stereum hirsutum (strain FP-91666) TaxID=721885 RepID=UPI000444A8B1|nr:DHS-like NAD/FAD-binding domain-containing protein [Stereum hirsutum FP-91666 SS1]EIM86806.1 DHS-like NAD/FAD-binding domain-containing protein [Stereum hirsutum FP-91666 SS1]
MRVSVPTIPHTVVSSGVPIPPAEAIERISTFLRPGNVAVLTGAGVSVDSGVKAYRGKDGRYMNPNYKPIFYHQLMENGPRGHAYRQRYWLRSYIGYPPVRDTLPNTTHFAIAALQHSKNVINLITQNVDGLHHKAVKHVWDSRTVQDSILELHGTLHRVHCKFGHGFDRDQFQEWLGDANPEWKAYMDDMEKTGQKPKTNPDGDVALEGVSYDNYVVPGCPGCLSEGRRNNVIKPDVIFFGESIGQEVRDRSYRIINECDRLFIIGTTLATYSAFRLLKHAMELKKPVLLLNVGPTRADSIPGIDKIEIPSGQILREVVRNVLGTRATYDPSIREMLESGIVDPPTDEGYGDGTQANAPLNAVAAAAARGP